MSLGRGEVVLCQIDDLLMEVGEVMFSRGGGEASFCQVGAEVAVVFARRRVCVCRGVRYRTDHWTWCPNEP
jgi:hypothetical protein